jgi:diguanylate cyclase (GGDEF)-like protein
MLKSFSARMFALALITGFLISLCTPLTYLCLAWKNKQSETAALAHQIAKEAQEIIICNQDSRQTGLSRLNDLAAFYQQKPDIRHVKLITHWSSSGAPAAASPSSLFNITQRVDIVARGIVHGYVEVTVTAASVIMSTVLLFGIFLGLALLTNTLLYRLPVSIVDENSKTLRTMSDRLKKTADELAHVNGMLAQAALLDNKTGLYNASQSIKRLDEEMSKINRYGGVLTLFMLDIDYFKQYNDRHGHIQGDEVLVTLAMLLKTQIRTNDLAGRFDGGKFILILPDLEQNQAATTADRLRACIELHPFPAEEQLPGGRLTVSIGMSIYAGGPLTSQQFIEQADQALCLAKNSGRNKLSIFQASAATTLPSVPIP